MNAYSPKYVPTYYLQFPKYPCPMFYFIAWLSPKYSHTAVAKTNMTHATTMITKTSFLELSTKWTLQTDTVNTESNFVNLIDFKEAYDNTRVKMNWRQ